MGSTEARGALRFVLLLSLSIVGCVSSGPASVSERAVDAAVKGKLDAFRRQLAPKAQSTLGTEQGMNAIRQKLAYYKNVSVGPALMISSKQGDQGYGHFGDVQQRFEATVAGSPAKGSPPEPIYTIQLQCDIAYDQYHHDATNESCTTTIDENGIPWTNCTPGSDAYDSIDLGESCAITAINETQKTNAE